MLQLKKLHHIAIICSDYNKSKKFYTEILGFKVIAETHRKERNSFKLDLALNEKYVIELFSFPTPPERMSFPEARGLRHLAFEVDDLEAAIKTLIEFEIPTEGVRYDETTKKKFTFFRDPDDLPIELYEA